MAPSLSELTSIKFYMEITHLASDASIYQTIIIIIGLLVKLYQFKEFLNSIFCAENAYLIANWHDIVNLY